MTDDKAADEPKKVGETIPPDSDAPTLDPRALYAFELIAGDAALTGALTDEVARILLDWAHDEIRRLVATTQEMNDCAAQASLAPKIRHLRRYLRKTARKSANEDNPSDALHDLLTASTYPEL
jgi:hypothetical protein